MKWADICWFEWCDQLVIYGSKLELAKQKKIICRLHSYEALTNNITQVNWDNVDKLIFVAEHIRKIVLRKVSINKEKTIIIPNGIDIDKYNFKEREKGFNIAYVGYINYKKGPMLLLHTFKAIYDKDNRYKLFIAGDFQDERYVLYLQQMISEMGLQNNVIYQGWQKDIDKWLEDKNYILCTSVLESQNMSVMQAMSKGLKPVIHNFVGAKEIYTEKYVWNTIEEAVDMISSDDYNSKQYRKFIDDNYSLNKRLIIINNLLKNVCEKNIDDFAQSNNKNNKDILTVDYIINIFNEFFSYDFQYIDNFNFNDYHIKIGKKEKVVNELEIIECIVENKDKDKLVLNNIWFDKKNKTICLPYSLMKSKNINYINDIIDKVLNLEVKYINNIGGFIFDPNILKDIKENKLAYMWERAIPATEFMPLIGYLKIAERYLFAGKQIKPSDTILEAASGFGYGAAYLSTKCKSVEAIDLAKENIIFAKEAYGYENINWKIGDVTKLPCKDNEFDVYTSLETLEHLPLDIVDKYFNEALRVLKASGKMIVSTPNREMRKNINNPFHIKEYNFNEYDKLLKKYFNNIKYFSVIDYKIVEGMKDNAINMIAICSNHNFDK